jgi:hypothetical protein
VFGGGEAVGRARAADRLRFVCSLKALQKRIIYSGLFTADGDLEWNANCWLTISQLTLKVMRGGAEMRCEIRWSDEDRIKGCWSIRSEVRKQCPKCWLVLLHVRACNK